MKFKVGDRVKILPSAKEDGINKADLGREAIVVDFSNYDSMYIQMVSPRPDGNLGWWVDGDNIILVNMTGQMLFDFMTL